MEWKKRVLQKNIHATKNLKSVDNNIWTSGFTKRYYWNTIFMTDLQHRTNLSNIFRRHSDILSSTSESRMCINKCTNKVSLTWGNIVRHSVNNVSNTIFLKYSEVPSNSKVVVTHEAQKTRPTLTHTLL